jgi:hypothetical protein
MKNGKSENSQGCEHRDRNGGGCQQKPYKQNCYYDYSIRKRGNARKKNYALTSQGYPGDNVRGVLPGMPKVGFEQQGARQENTQSIA